MFADARTVYAAGGSGARDEVVRRNGISRRRRGGRRESVRTHLVADVPVGVFLSGGIDSGALVSCASSAGAPNLQTFTVGFDDESSEVERARRWPSGSARRTTNFT